MKKLKFLVLFSWIVMLFVLVSCQEAQPTGQSPEPSATTEATSTGTEISTAYPAPESNTSPTLTEQSPVSTEVVSQATATQEVTPGAGTDTANALNAALTETSQAGAYPGPNIQITLPPTTLAANTTEPYPGPQQTVYPPTQTPGTGVPTATVGQGFLTTATGTLVSSTSTPTLTPTPGLVQTELRATDPKNFSLVGGAQLVEFFAFWSPTSKSMAPVMYLLQQKYQDRIQFSYLDIDDTANSLYKTLLGDRLPPVFFLLDAQGHVLAEFQGYVKPEEFEVAFSQITVGPTQAIEPTSAPPPTP